MTTDDPQIGNLAPTHEAIAELAQNIRIAQMQMGGIILAICRGPHRYAQYRDGQPPWCRACGYAASGKRISTDGSSRIGTNSGHGHAWDRPDGRKARCGGPGLCAQCSADEKLAREVER